ncbi:methyltransferase domain-containing protein [bacterium]|nr:methyltransferase domain-containing protein [bacterium]
MGNITKINLGGGTQKIEDFTNIDILNLPNVDIVHNINKCIPLPDNSIEEIYSSHCLEHLDDTIHIMKEIYRVCKPNAIVKIKVPYFKSIGAFKDPTHKQFFTEKTFDYFDHEKIKNQELPDYKLKVNFKVEKVAYLWSASWLRYLPFKKAFFLKHFWNIVRSIYYELRVIK